MSFSLHSSTENFGGGRRSSSSGSNSSSSCSVSLKSLIGRDVAERLGQALVQEPLEALALDGDQIGQLERLDEVGERVALAEGRTGGQRLLLGRRAEGVPGRGEARPQAEGRTGRRTATGEDTPRGERTDATRSANAAGAEALRGRRVGNSRRQRQAPVGHRTCAAREPGPSDAGTEQVERTRAAPGRLTSDAT